MTAWAFTDPPNVAVFTCKSIAFDDEWIAHVVHDAEDGAWQFHPAVGEISAGEAAVVALGTMVKLDPSIAELADLPLGWRASRPTRTSAWERHPPPTPSP